MTVATGALDCGLTIGPSSEVPRANLRDMSRRGFVKAVAGAAGLASLAGSSGCGLLSQPRIRTPYLFGLHVDQNRLLTKLQRAEALAERRADVVLVFAKIHDQCPREVEWLLARGYRVAICLELWAGSRQTGNGYTLRSVSRGDHDEELGRWFRHLSRMPHAVRIRPLHEFNGDWYPWGVFAPGNTPRDFAPAWRRIASLARGVAGSRVLLQLCVNRINAYNQATGTEQALALDEIYPGDDFVDELVINGYNRPTQHRSRSFASMVDRYYREMRALGPGLPLWIGETASTERFGDKPRWIKDMFDAVLTDYPVESLTWFNESLNPPGEPARDWSFSTTPASTAAFQAGLRRMPTAAAAR
jgi:mannan endo-1,4-beta-mannosidase